jgi:hypothetical protein
MVVKSRRMRWAEYFARMREKRNAYRILTENIQGMRLFGRSGCRWEGTLKMGLRRIWCEIVDWIELAPKRVQWLGFIKTPMTPGSVRADSLLTEQMLSEKNNI